MKLKLFLVDQIDFQFDDGFSFLKDRFQRIGLNFERDIFYLINFLNLAIEFRYFWNKCWDIFFRFLLYCFNILISFLSDLRNSLIFASINLRNLLFIRLFDYLNRFESEWAIRINFVWTKIDLLVRMTIMIL